MLQRHPSKPNQFGLHETWDYGQQLIQKHKTNIVASTKSNYFPYLRSDGHYLLIKFAVYLDFPRLQ